jgi:hypothetical protein
MQKYVHLYDHVQIDFVKICVYVTVCVQGLCVCVCVCVCGHTRTGTHLFVKMIVSCVFDSCMLTHSTC